MNEHIQQLIAECQQKHAEAVDQVQKWQAAALRAEGGLMVLQALGEQLPPSETAQESPPEPSPQVAD